MHIEIEQLEQLLEYRFSDRSLILQAVTHPSYLHEAGGKGGDYQRLEFLGDAVLGMLLAELLFERYPYWDEGRLSQLRSRLAGQDVLADRSRSLEIGSFIQFGRGEKQSHGREKDSILADVFEAILAAIYRDGGLEEARLLVLRLFNPLVEAPQDLQLGHDFKSELQEYLTAHDYPPPVYELIEESGPPHNRHFRFQIMLADRVIVEGEGKSKKVAQQAAAAGALGMFQNKMEQVG